MKLVKDTDNKIIETNKVSDKEAEEAIKTILSWMGEDPGREGLLETPKRVTKALLVAKTILESRDGYEKF